MKQYKLSKYLKYKLFIYFYFISSIFSLKSLNKNEVNLANSFSQEENKEKSSFENNELIEPEKEMEEIKFYMNEYANELMKNSNLKRKRLDIGQFPEEYPSSIRKNSKGLRFDRTIWGVTMENPTSLYRMCIYPNFKINYVSWCTLNFGIGYSKKRLNGCLNNYCKFCCGHLPFIYQDIINKNPIAQKLGMKPSKIKDEFNQIEENEFDFEESKNMKKILKKMLNNEMSEQCRAECDNKFPIVLPILLPKPPRDPGLGKSIENPAASCSDIKKWGVENAENGEYWLEIYNKGLVRAYCDMENEGGGWTLFFNYKHLPNQDIDIDTSKLPSNQNENSHVNLMDAGFTTKDVKELRFFCYESLNTEKSYWHFLTNDQTMINVALSGDQHELQKDSLSSGYTELQGIPGYKKKIFKEMIEDFDYIGITQNGGFFDTPFGSRKYDMYWTVKGQNKIQQIFECGSKHSHFGGYSTPTENPNMVNSHHMIFFRGEPPSEKIVRQRLNERMK